MDDIGESEDIPDTDVGSQNLGGFPTTTVATLITRTAWEQTITALQQLGVSVIQ